MIRSTSGPARIEIESGQLRAPATPWVADCEECRALKHLLKATAIECFNAAIAFYSVPDSDDGNRLAVETLRSVTARAYKRLKSYAEHTAAHSRTPGYAAGVK